MHKVRNFLIGAALVTMQSGCQPRPNPDCAKDGGKITLPQGAVVSWHVSHNDVETRIVITRTDLDYGYMLDEFKNGKVELRQIELTGDLQTPKIFARLVDESDIAPVRKEIDDIVRVCPALTPQP